jgi:predicted metal-binding protein
MDLRHRRPRPQADIDAIINMATRYDQTSDGIVPWRERPQSFRKGTVARIPPLLNRSL